MLVYLGLRNQETKVSTDVKKPITAPTNFLETENNKSATVRIYSPILFRISEFVFTTKKLLHNIYTERKSQGR